MVFLRAIVQLVAMLLCSAMLTYSETVPRIAIAQLKSQTDPTINGTIHFTEADNGTIHVVGTIIGLEPGYYGFHIHELGDISSCDATGPHFDPHGSVHGGRYHDVRHVGDFGNVKFATIVNGTPAIATVNFLDSLITFRGENNILGRSLVLHEWEDDLGEGNHEMSQITGNAGPRIACGVIGIRAGNWNSAISTYSSAMLVIFGIIFLFMG